MKRKLAVFFLSAAIACCGAAVISSCGLSSDDASNSGWSVQTAYAQAVDLGFEGTLEEFLALIEGEDGADGRDGVGIESATINDKGELVLTYTDGNTVNLGKVTGSDGQDGQNGTDGEDGQDGVGIKSATINDKGELVLTYTDDTTVNLGRVTGSDGQNGEDGKDGLNGSDGVGISKIYIEEGHLFIQLTDKNVVDCGALPSGVPCVHSYGEWVTEQHPTCMSIGYRTRVCQFCGDTQYDFLEPVGHSYSAQTAFTAVDGGHSFYCSVCGSYVMQPHSPDKEGNCACDYGLEYALAEDGLSYVVTDINNFSGTTLEIPAMHNGLPVSDMQASLYENIKSIIVPETLKAISGNTQSIQKVYISDLPAWIGVDKFVNLSFSSSTEFYVNGQLLTDYTIPEGTTRIGAYSYSNCLSLESITIPASVTEIGSNAFEYCPSLTSITIPATVKELGKRAFSFCEALKSVIFEEGSNLKSIGNGAFADNESLEIVVLPENLTEFKGAVFAGCTALTSIYIPKSVITMQNQVFDGCVALESVIFEEGSKLQSISYKVFRDCPKLKSLIIPEGVTQIGDQCFSGCSSAMTIVIPSSVTEIGTDVFSSNNVYYCGTEEQWKAIENNPYIGYGKLYYYSATQPTGEGRYWHYAEDGVTPQVW